jgi:hypothetical protein
VVSWLLISAGHFLVASKLLKQVFEGLVTGVILELARFCFDIGTTIQLHQPQVVTL